MATILLIHSVMAVFIYFLMPEINKLLSPRPSTFIINSLLVIFNLLVVFFIPISLGEILRTSLWKSSEHNELLIIAPHGLNFSMNLYNLFITSHNKQLSNDSPVLTEEMY